MYGSDVPRRNRVTPFSELIADPARGLVYGNRGCLHNARGEIVRHHQVQRWIACVLEFKDRRHEIMRPGHYTELFFLDEATAFAAGHRPCAECRRPDYKRYMEIAGATRADEIDARLAGERERRWTAPFADLPDGTIVADGGAAWLVARGALLRWTPAGYTERRALPVGEATVLTPPTSVAVLRAGWAGLVPLLHPTAE
ncbi:MAG: hypothetical protein QOF76_5207 [Solirubrobacteraceae bacterium]|jgi:hypothetical protein|nr:hypothetical protein [Solirubrobacteraceae bacterium]